MNDIVPFVGSGEHTAMSNGAVVTSIDISTVAGKRQLYRAIVGQDYGYDDVKDRPLVVTDVVLHTIRVEKEDSGEMVEAIRCVLITTDGARVAMVSDYIGRSLQALAGIFGPPPWPKGMVVRIVEQKSRRGRRYFVLDPVDELKPSKSE